MCEKKKRVCKLSCDLKEKKRGVNKFNLLTIIYGLMENLVAHGSVKLNVSFYSLKLEFNSYDLIKLSLKIKF